MDKEFEKHIGLNDVGLSFLKEGGKIVIEHIVITLSREHLKQMNDSHPKHDLVQFFIVQNKDGSLNISA